MEILIWDVPNWPLRMILHAIGSAIILVYWYNLLAYIRDTEFAFCLLFINFLAHAIAQAVGHKLPTYEARFQSHVTSNDICDEQRWAGIRFSPVSSVFLCYSSFHHCSIPAYHLPAKCVTVLTGQHITTSRILSQRLRHWPGFWLLTRKESFLLDSELYMKLILHR
jgi:hypothetical protein